MQLQNPQARVSVYGALLGFISVASAVFDPSNLNPTGAGCVDPDGYLKCYKTNSDTATDCVAQAKNTCSLDTQNECILACGEAQLASNIGCWIQSCWNQVYSCEYQLTAIAYFSGTDLVQSNVVPFYPPPDDAKAGACSCNLGYVYGNITYIDTNNCISLAGDGLSQQFNDCQCCSGALLVSNTLTACPKSNLTLFGIDDVISQMQQVLQSDGPTDGCTVLADSPDSCGTGTNGFGFPYPTGKPIYNPLSLTNEPGTEALTNQPGTAFTDFGADAYTLSLFPGYSSVIKPAPYNAKAAAKTIGGNANTVSVDATATGSKTTGSGAAATEPAAAGSGSSTGSSSETGSSTGTSAPSATESKKGGAGALKAQVVLVMGAVAAAIIL